MDQVNKETRPRLRLGHLTTRMLNQWTWMYKRKVSMVLHFLQSSRKMFSPTLLPSVNTRILNLTTTWILILRTTRNNLRVCSKAKKHSDKKKHKVRAKYYSQLSSEEDQSSVPMKKSTKPQQNPPSEPEHQQDSTDPVFYRE